MQVVLAGQQAIGQGSANTTFEQTSRGFSVFALVFVAVLIAYLAGDITLLCVREVLFALKDLFRRGAKATGT